MFEALWNHAKTLLQGSPSDLSFTASHNLLLTLFALQLAKCSAESSFHSHPFALQSIPPMFFFFVVALYNKVETNWVHFRCLVAQENLSEELENQQDVGYLFAFICCS